MVDVGDFVKTALGRRISQLEFESKLLHAQVKAMSPGNGIPEHCVTIAIYQNHILTALHSVYCEYHRRLAERPARAHTLQSFVTVHISIVQEMEQFLLQRSDEIDGRQDSLEKLTGLSLDSREPSTESLLGALILFFPYKWLFTAVVCNAAKVQEVLRCACEYHPTQHKQGLRAMFALFRDVRRDPLLMLGISEVILCFFVGDRLELELSDAVANFEFFANCGMLLGPGLHSLNLAVDLLPPAPAAPSDDFALSECRPQGRRSALFEADGRSLFPGLRHVVLELRKITTQVSPSLMAFRLFQALEWLIGRLSRNGRAVGADETFQFFVTVVADAKLFNLPTVMGILEQFCFDDLKSSKIAFVIAQLRIASQFIRSRKVAVAPFILLPFQAKNVDGIEAASPVAIEFKGLAVFAFPLWSDSPVPAVVSCTGDQSDVAELWQYEFKSGKILESPDVLCIGTASGTVLAIVDRAIESRRLIRVATLPFADAAEEIALVSNLGLMCARWRTGSLSTAMIAQLLDEFAKEWGLTEDQARPGAFEIIGDLQENLRDLGLLAAGFVVNGKIDRETLEAIKRADIRLPSGECFIDRALIAQVEKKACYH
jgi:hypothetical protein